MNKKGKKICKTLTSLTVNESLSDGNRVEDDDLSFITPPVSSHVPSTQSFHSEKTYFCLIFPEHKAGYRIQFGNFPIISGEQATHTSSRTHVFLIPLAAVNKHLWSSEMCWWPGGQWSKQCYSPRVGNITSNKFAFTKPTAQVNSKLVTALLKFQFCTVYGKTPQVSPWLKGLTED